MAILFGVMFDHIHCGKIVFKVLQEKVFDSIVKRRLISFDCQAVIGFFNDDLGGDLRLAATPLPKYSRVIVTFDSVSKIT